MKMLGLSPKIPEPPKATPMADEEAIRRAKKRSIVDLQSRGGRASTILGSALGSADKLSG